MPLVTAGLVGAVGLGLILNKLQVARTLKSDIGREVARRKEAASFKRRRAASAAAKDKSRT